jgi:hypothetical protein
MDSTTSSRKKKTDDYTALKLQQKLRSIERNGMGAGGFNSSLLRNVIVRSYDPIKNQLIVSFKVTNELSN